MQLSHFYKLLYISILALWGIPQSLKGQVHALTQMDSLLTSTDLSPQEEASPSLSVSPSSIDSSSPTPPPPPIPISRLVQLPLSSHVEVCAVPLGSFYHHIPTPTLSEMLPRTRAILPRERGLEEVRAMRLGDSSLDALQRSNQSAFGAINKLKLYAPWLISRKEEDLVAHRMEINVVEGEQPLILGGQLVSPLEATQPQEKIWGISLGRQYWFPGLESTIQFSQTYISPNWHKGGNNALNLHSKQLLRMTYKKSNVEWLNELEWRLGLNTALSTKDLRNYNISEDLIRLRSNMGIKAIQEWFYSLDVEAKSQLFEQRSEDKSTLYSTLLSPMTLTAGLGMKWVVDKKSKTYFGRRFRLDMNIAPLAYDFRWSHRKDIDMARHGFPEGKNIYSSLGSMLRANMIIDFTDSFAWETRLYYNTSFKRIETEWENTFSFAFNRYLSTRFNLLLRYDDAVPVDPIRKTRLQIYEMLTVGFDLKI